MCAQPLELEPGNVDSTSIDSSASNDDLFLPIALRKEKQTCTQCLISNFVPNHKLSPTLILLSLNCPP